MKAEKPSKRLNDSDKKRKFILVRFIMKVNVTAKKARVAMYLPARHLATAVILICLLPCVFPLSCSVCERGSMIYRFSTVPAWQMGNCSIYDMVDSDVTTCKDSDTYCLYRYEFYSFSGVNLTHVKRQCADKSVLSSYGLLNFTTDSCIVGSAAESLVKKWNNEVNAVGQSPDNIHTYGSGTYFCLFERQTGYVPTKCADGSVISSCDVCPQNCKGPDCEKVTNACFACSDGFWGAKCDKICPDNCKKLGCNQATGKCACAAGDSGDHCETSCPAYCESCDRLANTCICKAGYYGTDCSKQCNSICAEGTCDRLTGACSPCFTGYFGANCEHTCSTQCKNRPCDQFSGLCFCEAGFYGEACDKTCLANCKDGLCDVKSGFCACESGYWGEDCTLSCPLRCKNRTCDRINGSCSCSEGFYGTDCRKYCPSILCKDDICDKTTGECVKCVPGVFSDYCNLTCPSVCKNSVCEMETGVCIDCIPGYYGADCDDCPVECPYDCDSKTGKCPGDMSDVEDSKPTPMKKSNPQSSKAVAIAVPILVVIMIAGATVAIALFFWRRRNRDALSVPRRDDPFIPIKPI